ADGQELRQPLHDTQEDRFPDRHAVSVRPEPAIPFSRVRTPSAAVGRGRLAVVRKRQQDAAPHRERGATAPALGSGRAYFWDVRLPLPPFQNSAAAWPLMVRSVPMPFSTASSRAALKSHSTFVSGMPFSTDTSRTFVLWYLNSCNDRPRNGDRSSTGVSCRCSC